MPRSRDSEPVPPARLADGELVERVRRGEHHLFETLMRRHNQTLYRTARAVLRDDAEAEDAVQASWVKAYAALSTFEGRASLSTWLVTITLHEALARQRMSQRLVSLDEEIAMEAEGGVVEHPSATESPEAQAAGSELRATLTRSIDALPQPLRLVFVLREIEELSTEETSEALAISRENVKVRLHRARLALRRDIERQMGGEVRSLYGFDGARCDRTVAAVLARLGL